MNNYLDIILAPVITEKTANMEAEGKYAFKVANKANKTEIKQAIEKKFGVKVEKVNITNSHPKKKRVGKYTGDRKSTRLNSSHKHRSRMPSSA